MTKQSHEEHTRPHTRIDNAFIDLHMGKLTPIAAKLYVALCRHANWNTGECFPSQKRLAVMIGCDAKSLWGPTKELVKVGLIKVQPSGKGRSNVYTMLPVPLPNRAADEKEEFVFEDEDKKFVFEDENEITWADLLKLDDPDEK